MPFNGTILSRFRSKYVYTYYIMKQMQAERVIVWYYRNSGCRISPAYAFRIKLWYFFETGKWMKQNIRTCAIYTLEDLKWDASHFNLSRC